VQVSGTSKAIADTYGQRSGLLHTEEVTGSI